MTDAEIDSLAHKILDEAIGYVKMMAPLAVQVVTTNTSEPCLEFIGISKQGYGSFRCIYSPFQPIKQLIAESAHIFDNFEITLTDKKTGEVSMKTVGEYIPEHRDTAIKFMGKCAALLLVGSFYPRMGELFQDEFEDHKMMARAVLAEWMVTCLESDEFIHNKTDMRAAINLAVARVADRRRDSLRERLKGLPNIVAQKGPGAPMKPQAKRRRESDAYKIKVADAYRKIRLKTGKRPTKVSVARELGEGGISPKTHGESSAQAFRGKLQRLNLDWDAIAQNVENELNNNS